MERAVLFLYDSTRRRVTAMGAHELALDDFTGIDVTVEDAPIALRALTEGRVIEVSDEIERAVPAEYARRLGLTTLTCTPLAAGGRWLGVILADRGGGRFKLTDDERHTMWTLGKTAALATSARIATRSHEHARRLAERIDLARDIHERVMQRLFGVSLALSAEGELTREDRARSGGAPRVLAPDEFATYADDISPLQRSALEQSAIFFPYFAIGTTFDNGNARSRLSPAGIDVTPLAEYLERLLDFATRTRWGKRPVSRVEALAA